MFGHRPSSRTRNTGNNSNWTPISPDTGHQLSYSRKTIKRSDTGALDRITENNYIRPFELSVDTMQYLINTGKLFKITDTETRDRSLGSRTRRNINSTSQNFQKKTSSRF